MNLKKRQHNLQLPISRLPNEILSKVFCDLRKARRSRHGLQCIRDSVLITHVCHRWREVALDTASLWCHIDVLPPVRIWIPELLRRSKHSPLSVFIKWSSHRLSHGLVEQVGTHFGRVRELVLDCPVTATMQAVFVSKFQNLETLEISRSTARPFTLNDSHLRAESLRRLILRSCSIDWNSKLLQGLTHLRLVDIPDSCILRCHDFTLVLSNIPALVTLHLSKFLLKEKERAKTQSAKVHLQQLQQLSVKCAASEMARFLPCLVIPRSCKLHILTGNEFDQVVDEFRAILSWVSNQLRVPFPTSADSSHDQYIRSFHLKQNPEKVTFKVEGFCDVLSHEQLETAEPILKFVTWWNYYNNDFSSILQTFLSLFPLDGITFLGVDTNLNVYLSPEFWMGSFGSIQTLKTIYLNTETSNFWEALIPAKGDKNSLPFSALTSVVVDDDLVDSQLELILRTLRARSELGGTQLRDLLFRYEDEGGVPPSIVIPLSKLVSDIRVVEYDANGSYDTDDSFSEDNEYF